MNRHEVPGTPLPIQAASPENSSPEPSSQTPRCISPIIQHLCLHDIPLQPWKSGTTQDLRGTWKKTTTHRLELVKITQRQWSLTSENTKTVITA